MIRILLRRTLRPFLGILILILAIFIAESFTTLMTKTLENNGSVWRLALILLLKTPEIMDFGLPLALTLGVYLAVTAARDANELVICASAGLSWLSIPIFGLIMGVAGLAVSAVFAAWISPNAAYMMRLSFHDLESRGVLSQLEEPGPRSFVRSLEGRTVISAQSADPLAERGNLFIFNETETGGWQFQQADDWQVVDAQDDTNYKVNLKSYRQFSGDALGEEVQEDEPEQKVSGMLSNARIRTENAVVDVEIDGLLPELFEGRETQEILFFGMVAADGSVNSGASRSLGQALARAVLCPVAVFFAIAAAAWSVTGLGRYLALPLMIVAVMAFDIFGSTFIADAYVGGLTGLGIAACVASAVALAVPLGYIFRCRESMVLPRRARA